MCTELTCPQHGPANRDEDPVATVPENAAPACECFVTDPSTWLSAASCGYGGGYEPGSQMEWNPDCPAHPPAPPECNGICLTAGDIGLPYNSVAYPHPDCELHGRTSR